MKKHKTPMNFEAFRRLIKLLSSFQELHPKLEPYLAEEMEGLYCDKTVALHEQDEVVNKAYFISTGFIIIYRMVDGVVQVLRICGQDEIVAGASFMIGDKSRYYVIAVKGSFLLEVTAKEMEYAYLNIPGTESLARKVLASFEEKELKRDEMIRRGGEESILYFYTEFPELLPPGTLIKDEWLASYLMMSVTALKTHRRALKAKGLINW